MSSACASVAGALAAFSMVLAGCGGDSLAGKTTTTTNGGGGVVALGPDGRPIAGVVVLAARSWDPERGTWGGVDTLRGDAAGMVLLPNERYAFLEVRDVANPLGSWTKGVVMREGTTLALALDTLRILRGNWADRARAGRARFYLDSSFRSIRLSDTGTGFDLPRRGRTYRVLLPLPLRHHRHRAVPTRFPGWSSSGDLRGIPFREPVDRRVRAHNELRPQSGNSRFPQVLERFRKVHPDLGVPRARRRNLPRPRRHPDAMSDR